MREQLSTVALTLCTATRPSRARTCAEQLLFVFIFMVVETSGGAGGTSGVAGAEFLRVSVGYGAGVRGFTRQCLVSGLRV